MVANFLKTFRILREHRVAVSHPSSTEVTHRRSFMDQNPKVSLKKQEILDSTGSGHPVSIPLPAAPLSPCHPTQRLSRTCTFQHNQMAVRICPLTYDLAMSGMENPGHGQQEFCPGTFSNWRSPSAWPFTVVFYFYLPLSYFFLSASKLPFFFYSIFSK